MNRRDFIKRTAISCLITNFPNVSLAGEKLIIQPSGSDDTATINSTLRASVRIGVPAVLAEGAFTVTSTIIVPAGARLIGKGRASIVTYDATTGHEVIRIDEPHIEHPIKQLYVENKNSPVPFVAIIG